jgi:YVTN family beta-propeller protein
VDLISQRPSRLAAYVAATALVAAASLGTSHPAWAAVAPATANPTASTGYATTSISIGNNGSTAVAVDPALHRVYIGNNNNTVSVIDAVSRTVIGSVPLPSQPADVAVDTTTHTVYAILDPTFHSSQARWSAVAIDPTSLQVVKTYALNGGLFTHIAIASAQHFLVLTSGLGSSGASLVNTISSTQSSQGTTNQASGVAFDPTDRRIWVSNGTTAGTVSTFTIADPTQTVVHANVGTSPQGIAVDPTNDAAYVANTSSVSVINGHTNAVSATIPVNATPTAIAVDPSTHFVFVADGAGNQVVAIDGTTNTVTTSVPLTSSPHDIAVDPSTHSVWVVSTTGNTVTVLDPIVTRFAGADRFATAAAISADAFPNNQADAVVLARADNYPDALVGAPLAAAKNAPLLFTSGVTLPAITKAEIERVLVRGKAVYLLGGAAAIPNQIVAQLTALGYSPIRIAGADRFATAVAVADALGDPTTVLLASGGGFADALAAGPAAAHAHGVILLTGDPMPSETVAYLAAHLGKVYGIGGPAAAADWFATPIVGPDRFATAVLVAQQFFSAPTHVGVASGATFPDALAAGAFMARIDGPLLLTTPTALAASPSTYISSETPITSADIFGGTAALSAAVQAQAGTAMQLH